ncbi:hypothetical protein BKA66DRAFT_458955 [Pyrenochaeta sp. MPI-SDFR-AT-0127]|nr:hypothetical protein BKA66DRAFT_458955 [Pyrenochaeta sp. MPI-SDFR-AT-0127]
MYVLVPMAINNLSIPLAHLVIRQGLVFWTKLSDSRTSGIGKALFLEPTEAVAMIVLANHASQDSIFAGTALLVTRPRFI